MKKTIPAFLAGVLTTALISTVAVYSLAISSRMTIEVDPVNVQVNGEVFAPTDVNGDSVPVFAYNGTTYAPLRALAEAYGLEVGYDKETNMATVASSSSPSTPSQADTKQEFDYSYEEFVGLWEAEIGGGGATLFFYAKDSNKALTWWDAVSTDLLKEYMTNISQGNDVNITCFKTREGVIFADVALYLDNKVTIRRTSHEVQ